MPSHPDPFRHAVDHPGDLHADEHATVDNTVHENHEYDDWADRYAEWSDGWADERGRRRPALRRSAVPPRRRREPDDAFPAVPAPEAEDAVQIPEGPELPGGLRWSSWGEATQGPEPTPGWVITELAAVDRELGVLKSGKEADVHLVERSLPGHDGEPDIRRLLAAKRYRDGDHRMFHRDAAYLEGRRVRRSRETRAMARRTSFGRELLAGQWAGAEFGFLSRLWLAGAPVPYPVQLLGTELMMEFVGDSAGQAAPRLARLRPGHEELDDLWRQCVEAMRLLAEAGYAHGDLSAYNLLVHEGRLVLIDLPQAVDVVANPQGPAFLRRDVENVVAWFASRGMRGIDPADLTADLLDAAGLVGADPG